MSRKPTMYCPEKSDGLVVPTKSPNEAVPPAEEAMEGRSPAKGNTGGQNAPRTQRRTSATSALNRVREAARRDRKKRFTALLHHVTIDRLRDAYLALERKAAAGVDGVTWNEYGRDLEARLADLHARVHRGAYRAKPSRRVYIPKPDGRERPLGIASLEDKIVQRAVVEVLNAIYEVDFLGFSYGFRPGRSQHHALDALATAITRKKVNWVLEVDIRGFFDAIDHTWMVKFIEHRIADKRIVRLIQKWLAAGVLEEGKWSSTAGGTPQGATISPLLANVYLHYVLDLWVQQWRGRVAWGEVIVVRYADDFVLGFQHEADAVRFRTDLERRLGRFGLEVHPDKTRLFRFGRHAAANHRERGEGKPQTFDFLGFTHICGKSRAGKFLLLRRTSKKRMRAKLKSIREVLHKRRHVPVPVQGRWLKSVVGGYFAYHAVPSNIKRLGDFRTQVIRSWHFALRRRSQRTRTTWERMNRLANRWIPPARILHPYPWDRFDDRTRGRSRVR
ncbi:group II intron reverse transcriptase/maturase [Nannocystis sp. ILAH1]|nr:group II intron reverse transcriptase/maturase [Nannocystis sp. ILAH1]MCY0991086.1 group II intron reverse transcriptase/maturase [Nannocystis sp. ILAH1]